MTTEKRLIVEVRATRQAYDDNVINDIGWIMREYNVSDSLTKSEVNAIMRKFMMTEKSITLSNSSS